MKNYCDVVIVGAGASGLLCGGMLAKEGFSVTIIEKNTRVGKKLSATGNGRCNYTNLNMSENCFYGDEKWIKTVLDTCTSEDVIRKFESIGVFHREKDGYVYPYTNQASTVINALEKLCERYQAEMVMECKVTAIIPDKENEGYRVRTSDGEIRCQYVVIATGGKASPELGGDGSGYKLARSLGHSIHSVFPALTGLVCEGDYWKQVAGTRIQGKFSLLLDQKLIEGETGEIQIVKDGVSGIPVFQLCRVAAKALSEGRQVKGVIDFVPPMEESEIKKWVDEFGVSGLVPQKWITLVENRAELEKVLKSFSFPIVKTFGMERAQVTAGGIPTEEVVNETMESKKAKGVFLIGEVLDVDGICGGYNLHFAWATANLATKEMIRIKKGK